MSNFVDPKDLIVAALAQIETHPETWDQSMWRDTEAECGTSYCLAGWMAQLDGVRWTARYKLEDESRGELHVQEWAVRRLGDDARSGYTRLFWTINTLDDLRVGVKAYVNDENVFDAMDAVQD